MTVSDDGTRGYLTIHTDEISIEVSSDSITHSYQNRESIKHITEHLVDEVQNFRNLGYTIGGSIIFPRKRIDGKMTINGARGFSSKIADRFDLTLECIRLHYSGKPNPLDGTLNTNSHFFNLFGSFRGYVDFFLISDLVTPDYKKVKFFTLNSSSFDSSPIPQNKIEYLTYMKNSVDFLVSRNKLIKETYSR